MVEDVTTKPGRDRIAEAVQEVIGAESRARARLLGLTGVISLAMAAFTFGAYMIYAWRVLREFHGAVIFTYAALGGAVTFAIGYACSLLWLRARRPGRVLRAAKRAQVAARDVDDLLF